MTREEILDHIQNRLSGIGQCDWATPLTFMEDMKSLLYHERKKDMPGFEGTWDRLNNL